MSELGYKNLRVLDGMLKKPWHPKLISVLQWIVVRYSKGQVVITSAYRDTGGIHSTDPLRAFDMRSRHWREPERIEKDINDYWIYDPERNWFRVCLYHTVSGPEGWHFHIQVHDNTILNVH